LGAGGAEKLIVDMAPIMVEKGYLVEVVIFSSYKDVFSHLLKENNITVTFISNSSHYWNIFGVYKLYNILKNKDIIYTHVVHAQYFIALLSVFLPKNIQLITIEHSTHNRRRNKKIFRLLERFIYSRYDKIISITKQVEKNLLNHLQLNKNSKFTVIENGINLDIIRIAKPIERKDLGLDESDIVIIMIGRFTKAKDQDTLIRAISVLNKNYKVIFVGEGELLNNSIELAQSLNLLDRVQFLGFRKDIPSLLKMSDIGVLSSHWEGQPLSVIEIMASGIAFVGSKVPGIIELAEDYGVLFREQDAEDCAEKISNLIKNKKYYDLIVQKCIKRSQEYSINITVEKYLNLFESSKENV